MIRAAGRQARGRQNCRWQLPLALPVGRCRVSLQQTLAHHRPGGCPAVIDRGERLRAGGRLEQPAQGSLPAAGDEAWQCNRTGTAGLGGAA